MSTWRDETVDGFEATAGLASALRGLLAFPVTAFDPTGELDVAAFARHVSLLLSYEAGALFPACGTGELQSLSLDEYEAIVEASVAVANGSVPVVPGVGFGRGIAAQMALIAQDAGADGVLVFPPYLDAGDPQGQLAYYAELAALVDIAVIVYQRGRVTFSPATIAQLAQIPNVIGLKDGTGEIKLVRAQRAAVSDPAFVFLNGVPTAELVAVAMAECGVQAYSSALLNMVPEFATNFYTAVTENDAATVERLTREVVLPFVALRDKGRGYAISLIKAGVRLRGGEVGSVRAPLSDPTAAHLEELTSLLSRLGLRDPLVPQTAQASSQATASAGA